jgi:hypothetical protein
VIVVTAKPFETREEVPRVRIPELEASEDIDPSLEAVSRPHAEDEAQPECINSASSLTGLKIFLWQQVSEVTRFRLWVLLPRIFL